MISQRKRNPIASIYLPFIFLWLVLGPGSESVAASYPNQIKDTARGNNKSQNRTWENAAEFVRSLLSGIRRSGVRQKKRIHRKDHLRDVHRLRQLQYAEEYNTAPEYWDDDWESEDEPEPDPTPDPTRRPTRQPTREPTRSPTRKPTRNPTPRPTPNPTPIPSLPPTPIPTTPRPSQHPTPSPTKARTPQPTPAPSPAPSPATASPTTPNPTPQPTTPQPTRSPTPQPVMTSKPTYQPTLPPSPLPTPAPKPTARIYTLRPSPAPTSGLPTRFPTPSPRRSNRPTSRPSRIPTTGAPTTGAPIHRPSTSPTAVPTTSAPTGTPSESPTANPTGSPSAQPSPSPVVSPTTSTPSIVPSSSPSAAPSNSPSAAPTVSPSPAPTFPPSSVPSFPPSAVPTFSPAAVPTVSPTHDPSSFPSIVASSAPTIFASTLPSSSPSNFPSTFPSIVASSSPTAVASSEPSSPTSESPSSGPSISSERPTSSPSSSPISFASAAPSAAPSSRPSTSHPEVTIEQAVITVSPTMIATMAPTTSPQIASSKTQSPSTMLSTPTAPNTPRPPIEHTKAPAINPTTTATTQPALVQSLLPPSDAPASLLFGGSIPLDELQHLTKNKGEATLAFSLWFPEHRASDLDISAAENGVLNSLEVLFCNLRSSSLTVDSLDNLCVLFDHVLATEVAVLRQRQAVHYEDPDATILLAPYVSYLDERYALEGGRRFAWTTWKVTFEIFQHGRPVLQHTLAAIGSNPELTGEEIFLFGAQTIEERMKDVLDRSMRNGEFNTLLASHVSELPVFSSPLAEELETFGFLEWGNASLSGAGAGSDPLSPKKSDPNITRERVIIAATAALALVVFVGVGFYLFFQQKQAKAAWMKERERHIIMELDECEVFDGLIPIRRALLGGETSTAENAQGSAVPAEINLVEGGTPISQPSFDMRPIKVVTENHDDQNESGISSLDCTLSVVEVDMPWKAMPAKDSVEGA